MIVAAYQAIFLVRYSPVIARPSRVSVRVGAALCTFGILYPCSPAVLTYCPLACCCTRRAVTAPTASRAASKNYTICSVGEARPAYG